MSDSVTDLTSSFEIIRRICGDKWKFLTLCYLFNGPKRFGELQYHLDSITQKVLTENLRSMEQMGLICRVSYPGTPLRVEYSLTEMGQSLQPIFQELIVWGLNYSQEQRRRFRDGGADK